MCKRILTVKLLQETDEHHLPDAQQAQRPWAIRLLKRALIHLFSPSGLTISIGILLIFILTGIISLSYVDITRGIDRNGVSLVDVFADSPLEIADKEATQRKIDRTRQSIPPVYQDAEPHNQDILSGLDKFLSELGNLATDTKLAPLQRSEGYQKLTTDKPNAQAIYGRYFKKPITTVDWDQVHLTSQKAMQRILKSGFTEADEQLKRASTIRQSIPETGYRPIYRDLIEFLVDANLEPNLILDEAAMKKKQSVVADQIALQPEIRVYHEGDRIVGRGEKVSPIEMAALEKLGKAHGNNNWVTCLGIFLLCMLFVFTLWSYLFNFKNREYFKPPYAALIATLVLISAVFFQLQDSGAFGDVPLYAFPLAAISLTLAIFMHPHFSVLATTLLVFLLALTMRGNFQSLTVLLFGSYMGTYILNKRISYSDRGQLMYAGLFVGITNTLLIMALSLMKPAIFGMAPWSSSFDMLSVTIPGLRLIAWGFCSGIFSGILTIGSLPLLETIFRLVTPYTLMEIGNHDHPLLKRMQFEAPGTFHHSLMVATLAEAAAESVGANALLTRVGCLYHDIGKMKRPLFFIENQAYFGVENPHDKLTPRLSKMVITAHPRDSIEMAKQHKLPEVLMKFMTEHHGTLTAGYFYNKACIEEGMDNVNKSQFRYPGPKPGSKETAIVMLADACESAVRALKAPTVAQVEERIDKIIHQRIEDGQFDNCPITFQDIHRIKQTFVRVLRGIQHNRIEYQQNMMRELGRKIPSTLLQDQAGLQDAMKQAQKKPE
jgi:putative nucleotidyltransferase with HDIG domain